MFVALESSICTPFVLVPTGTNHQHVYRSHLRFLDLPCLEPRSRATLEPLAAAGLDRIRGPASDFAVLLGNFSVADLVAKADFAKVSLSAASAKDMTHRSKRRGATLAGPARLVDSVLSLQSAFDANGG
jgi:hypothetical protein